LPRAVHPSSVSRRRPRPRLTSSSLASTKSTEKPAWAATCTMPEPMRPQPITPPVLMARREGLLGSTRSAATAGTRRRLEELAAGRTVVPDDDGRVAVTDAAVGLDLALQRRLGRCGRRVAQRLGVGLVTGGS